MSRRIPPRDPFEGFEGFRFEGMPSIHLPRPPRRFWIGIGFLVVALLVVFLAAPLIGILTETQWYTALGLRQVYLTRLGLQAALVGVSFVVALIFSMTNIWIALHLRVGPRLRTVGVRARTVSRGTWALGLAGSIIIALLLSSSAGVRWTDLVLFTHANSAGVTDPLFHLDVSFYILQLPFLHVVLGWVLGLVFLTGIAVAVLYAWRQEAFTLDFSRTAVAHLSVLAAILLAGFGVGAWLDRFDLLFGHDSVVYGAGYADVNAGVSVQTIRVVVLGLMTILLAVNVGLRRRGLILAAFGVWIGASAITGIYPQVVQRLIVQPSELSVEAPFISREISFTRRAFGLDNVVTQNYDGSSPLTPAAIANDSVTIQNLRLWDNSEILDTYSQLQSLRTYYSFQNISLDRYTINGKVVQVEIAARELDPNKLPDQAQSWVNRKLVYTHGYSVAASPVSAVVGEGLPDYIASDIPTTGPLKVTVPQVYFGQLTNDYVLAPSAQAEFDFPQGSGNAHNTYKGTEGVPMTSFNRALWSLRTGDFNLLISDQIQNRTQILFRRNILSRVSEIAPFLTVDSNPYVVVSKGRLYWIVDAYTSASTYPYSQPDVYGENYIRNSVKVVIDAYSGSTTFYIADSSDPIIRAYQATFPELFRPLSTLDSDLRAHLRVPEHLFAIQARTYATYHISNPSVLYNREDVWDLPLSPYYVEMRLPGESQAEYLQILPFTPINKENLVSWLAVRNDPSHYGQMVSYILPKDKVVLGPQQVLNRISNTPAISRDYSLLNQNGSSVIKGNLLVVPVGGSFLYFQPWYLKAVSTGAQTGGLPELKKVILADSTGQTPVAYQDTLNAALAQLVGEATSVPPVTGSGGTPSTPSPTPTASPTPVSPALQSLVSQALAHYDSAQTALKQGDLATYASEMQQVSALLVQIQQLENSGQTGSPSAKASPTPHPSPSASS
ncbi:MAG: UPF0182 family protein [Candidatus Dormibacteraceae bacterium]